MNYMDAYLEARRFRIAACALLVFGMIPVGIAIAALGLYLTVDADPVQLKEMAACAIEGSLPFIIGAIACFAYSWTVEP